FQRAIELKADYIEFDVHQSKDGEIVIIHDAYITDIYGKERFIKNMELRELKDMDVGEGEKIPTLKELVKIAKGNIGLQCEVKASNFSKDLVELLEQENLIETSIISSFLFKELLELQKLNSNIKLALLIPPEVYSPHNLLKYCQKAIKSNFYAVHPYFESINKEFVKSIHEYDMLVNVWTVNEESEIKKVLEMGVDGIISDNIQLVKNLLNKR
ncbi:MAG: glycerophosphodiester phosphodiesterase, partial [Candidatus Hodarchaeota archaeon]